MSMTNLLLPEKTGMEALLGLLWHFVLNLAVVMLLARWLYYSNTRRKDFLFTFIMVSTIVFLLCYMLDSVTLQLGFALGLFAIFGILRYRTDTIPIKEMTYLFVIIGISVINALAKSDSSIIAVVFTNVAVILVTLSMEKIWLLSHESSKIVIYDKVKMIRPESYNELIKDLETRTGVTKISRIEIGKVDLLRDICEIKIFYYVTNPESAENDKPGTENDDED